MVDVLYKRDHKIFNTFLIGIEYNISLKLAAEIARNLKMKNIHALCINENGTKIVGYIYDTEWLVQQLETGEHNNV